MLLDLLVEILWEVLTTTIGPFLARPPADSPFSFARTALVHIFTLSVTNSNVSYDQHRCTTSSFNGGDHDLTQSQSQHAEGRVRV